MVKKNATDFICFTILPEENELEDLSKSTKKLNVGSTLLLIAYLSDENNSSEHKARLVNTLFSPCRNSSYFDGCVKPEYKKEL